MPTLIDLRATLATLIAGTTETCVERWEALIGDVAMLPLAFHPRCNWRIAVGGVEDERTVLDASTDLL